jgi:hypothetical protein
MLDFVGYVTDLGRMGQHGHDEGENRSCPEQDTQEHSVIQ